jgi:hypothetical protein|tara:strand:+ start:1143 stop:1403 length:261 start_codon:yes stop_codon:yes gene_type:complete
MIKLIIGGMIGAALFASVVKADEQKTVTPKEFVETVVSVPGKVSTHLQNEWVDIKAYQAKSWADSKDQFARTVDSIKSLFTTKSTK